MVDPFGEISFLTRSENRVTVLTTLADAPQTERDLVDETNISDVTVGRIVEDLEKRGWITDDEHGAYRATGLGELLAADYRRLERSMNLACRLGPVREYLPIEEIDFDLRHLLDATISDPETFDALRAVDRWKQLLREADRVVGTAPAATATPVVAEPYHEAVTEGELEFEALLSWGYYRRANSRPEMRELLRELLRGGAEFYLASEDDEPLPFIATFDDLATLTGYDETGTLHVGIETYADPVREWVRETYERYRGGDPRRLTPEDFTG